MARVSLGLNDPLPSVCLRCGAPTPLTVASTFRVSVIPPVMREVGALLVLPVGVAWPLYFALKFFFKTPPLELVLLLTVVLLLVWFRFMTVRARVVVPYCARHAGHRQRRSLLWVAALLLLPVVLVGPLLALERWDVPPWQVWFWATSRLALPGLATDLFPGAAPWETFPLLPHVCFFAWLVLLGWLALTTLRPVALANQVLTVKGASPRFIAAMRELRQQSAKRLILPLPLAEGWRQLVDCRGRESDRFAAIHG